ncbi:hypothetical protein L228DRAFT_64775 [Xylona heveae TC161]|uniref:Secreted protein n=1 Tax=Xylona heveae (strain CBS 132557 / TC161) TaxID=1328760 RepID=A0A165IQE5_XYLHT|nr:hypothetical protein L228DRAFT_64775 [Xylona heveae TC161]KZF25233.1 hypothetical protein L228DRAFT_64775 [Xylona heveae TC161]
MTCLCPNSVLIIPLLSLYSFSLLCHPPFSLSLVRSSIRTPPASARLVRRIHSLLGMVPRCTTGSSSSSSSNNRLCPCGQFSRALALSNSQSVTTTIIPLPPPRPR